MKRGDVFLADLDPSKGSEQAGRRPVLVFQNNRLIAATLTVVVIPLSIAICHQIRALDKPGLVERWGTIPQERLLDVERVVLRTLGVAAG
jgi:mRNA interferase MazF